MEINVRYIGGKPSQSINAFADEHGLTMSVDERKNNYRNLLRFCASFDHVEGKEGSILVGHFGNGDTPEEAINNYAKRISGKLLVVNAYGDRVEIQAPELTEIDEEI